MEQKRIDAAEYLDLLNTTYSDISEILYPNKSCKLRCITWISDGAIYNDETVYIILSRMWKIKKLIRHTSLQLILFSPLVILTCH